MWRFKEESFDYKLVKMLINLTKDGKIKWDHNPTEDFPFYTWQVTATADYAGLRYKFAECFSPYTRLLLLYVNGSVVDNDLVSDLYDIIQEKRIQAENNRLQEKLKNVIKAMNEEER